MCVFALRGTHGTCQDEIGVAIGEFFEGFGDWNLNIVGYGSLSFQMMLKCLSQSNEWSHGIIMNIDSNYHHMQNLHTTFLALDDWLGSFSKPELLFIVLM